MKKNNLIQSAAAKLDRARVQYIEAQIKFESGLSGLARKAKLPGAQKPQHFDYFSAAQEKYYQTLNEFREIIIAAFKRGGRLLTKNDLELIARLTVFDELEKLKDKKEHILRSRGLAGIIRSQVQDWRQISPNFKMVFGAIFLFFGLVLNFASSLDIKWFQITVLVWGAMIFLEGAQQKMTKHKAARIGMNRLALFKTLKRRLPIDTRNLNQKLARLHLGLEENIWNLRIFEKRTEYRRYLLSALAGVLVCALFFVPYGIRVAFFSSVTSIFSRVIWFLLPYGAIRSGLTGIFKASPAEASTFQAVQDGEGSVLRDPAELRSISHPQVDIRELSGQIPPDDFSAINLNEPAVVPSRPPGFSLPQ